MISGCAENDKTGYLYGDYRVLYLAGMGSFARVFRAEHRITGQVAAVKVLRECFSGQPGQCDLFVREGRLGRTLRHPNIVPIHEVSSRGDEHFLVMEFVEGCTLRELVRVRKSLDPLGAARLMADIARGLDYAFTRSVIHRDLRMTNVLVSSRGGAKLVDFGLAGIDREAQTGDGDAAPGRSVEYAALERATGAPRDDPRSDLFFAGCLFYHMLCGQSPLYEGPSRQQRLDRSQFRTIVPIHQRAPSLPLFVASVVGRAMALDPSRRYQTPREMLADVESALRRLGERSSDGLADTAVETGSPGETVGAPVPQRSVMVVAANPRMQDMLREGLKNAGYRVLLTGDPQRAVERLSENPGLVDCMVFDAQEIGQPALDCFNRLSTHSGAQSLPALLLLGQTQRTWSARAQFSARRRALLLPATMKQLRAALEELLANRLH